VPGSAAPQDLGVIIHAPDGSEDPVHPWMVCSDGDSCKNEPDRLSASVVYLGTTAAFSGGGGVIVNPRHSRLLCGYGGDGGSRGRTCNPPGETASCKPGCMMSGANDWCDPSSIDSGDYWCDGRPWRPSDLGSMLAAHRGSSSYNEVVVEAKTFNDALPWSVEAIITSPGDPTTLEMHARFLQTYGITAADVPLVTFHKELVDRPFVCAVCDGMTAIAGATMSPNAAGGSTGSAGPSGDISDLGYG